MAEKKTAEQRAAALDAKAKEMKAKAAAIRRKEQAKADAKAMKVIKGIFTDMPSDESEVKKYFEKLLKYAEMGVRFEERQKAQQQQQAQHSRQ